MRPGHDFEWRSSLWVLGGAAALGLCMTSARAQTAPAAPAVTASSALPVVPAPTAAQPLPANRWTLAQAREAFDAADSDRDGVLTRGEAQRLIIMPRSFEDMDVNKDGTVSRAEFEASFPR